MNRDPTFYIIMTLTALLVICGVLLAGKAQSARGCLDREQAQRTWPTRSLGQDESGCWSYVRRGDTAPPKPPVIDLPYICTPRQAEEGECLPLLNERSAVLKLVKE